MSIDIEALMVEVDKFKNRLAQLEDELTLPFQKTVLNTAQRGTVRQRQIEEGADNQLAILVRSAFSQRGRRSRRI